MNALNHFRVSGKVVIVTGASSGLGVSFARSFAEAGAKVVLGARRADKLEHLATEIESCGGAAVPVVTDVTDPEAAKALVAAAVSAYGRVDVLLNNAGVGTAVPALTETPKQFQTVLDVNLSGSYWTAQACATVMPPGSSIINISSILGFTTAGLPQAAYSASKAAIGGLTRDLAQQWGPRRRIRVNAIAPGFFATEMTDQYPQGYLAEVAPRLLLGRLGHTDELAATAIWLASPAAGYVTGQTIIVDGGVTIT